APPSASRVLCLRPRRRPSTLFPYTTLFRSAERGHVVGEEHALAEALLEVERGGLKASRGVGLGPRDFGRDPERAVHPLTDHQVRSEEHTSELQSRFDLVCCLLLEKKHWPRL